MHNRRGNIKNPGPALLLRQYAELFRRNVPPGPILDLACGDGRNGIFIAKEGLEVVLCDASEEALARARDNARENGVAPVFWQADLEKEGENPLRKDVYGGILVFRYLHRPLIPCIRKGLKKGGLLIYETFTIDQPRYGKPHNPDYLLKRGELLAWFADWTIIYYREGVENEPERAVAQIVCRKP